MSIPVILQLCRLRHDNCEKSFTPFLLWRYSLERGTPFAEWGLGVVHAISWKPGLARDPASLSSNEWCHLPFVTLCSVLETYSPLWVSRPATFGIFPLLFWMGGISSSLFTSDSLKLYSNSTKYSGTTRAELNTDHERCVESWGWDLYTESAFGYRDFLAGPTISPSALKR